MSSLTIVRGIKASLWVLLLTLAACSEIGSSPPTTDLVVSPTGTLTLDGRLIAEKDLVQELKAIRERAPDKVVYVRLDATQSDTPPVLSAIFRATEEARVGITVTSYREQEEARRRKSRLDDLLFFGRIVLVGMFASLPFALKAKTPGAAMGRGFVGVMVASVIFASLYGLVVDIADRNTAGSWNVRFVVLPIAVAPCAVVGGLLVGCVCALRVRFRSANR